MGTWSAPARARNALLAVLTAGALVAPVAVGTPDAAAGTERTARFARIVDRTPSVVHARGPQQVVVAVRVVDRRTARPVRGRIWFVDAGGARVSARFLLDERGRATVRHDPAPSTRPGRHAYRIRYGGTRGVAARTSRAAVRFTVPAPPRDTTPDATVIAAPDYLNQDIGDVSGLPGWDPSDGNSWNEQTERSIDWVLGTIADRDPDAFLVPGDIVEGRWGNPDNTTGIFGTPEDTASMARGQSAFYHRQNVEDLEEAGLMDIAHIAVGDHDVGDNPWGDIHPYPTWKRQNLGLWRDAFAAAYTTAPGGGARYADRPVGTEWDRTAYATMVDPETLVVSVDVFDRTAANVRVRVVGAQLQWLDRVLDEARRTGVRWIIVQGHAPILPAAIWHSSGLHVEGGRKSPLWQVLKRHRVQLYVAGEVHTTSRTTLDGVTQVATGAPLTTGKTSFLQSTLFADRMNLSIWKWDVPANAPADTFWQGGCPAPLLFGVGPGDERPEGCDRFSRNAAGNKDYTGFAPAPVGHLTISVDGRTTPGSGLLAPWDGVHPVWRGAAR